MKWRAVKDVWGAISPESQKNCDVTEELRFAAVADDNGRDASGDLDDAETEEKAPVRKSVWDTQAKMHKNQTRLETS